MKIFRESFWDYRLTMLIFKWRYIKFILHRNWEFDYAFLVELMILKLTFMGYIIRKYGQCEKNKQVAHSIWKARKALKKIDNEDTIYKQWSDEGTDERIQTYLDLFKKYSDTALDEFCEVFKKDLLTWWD